MVPLALMLQVLRVRRVGLVASLQVEVPQVAQVDRLGGQEFQLLEVVEDQDLVEVKVVESYLREVEAEMLHQVEEGAAHLQEGVAWADHHLPTSVEASIRLVLVDP